MSKKIRLTKRQKKMLAELKRQEEINEKLLSRKPTIHEACEVQYLKIQRKVEDKLKKIEKMTRAIRSDYLNHEQKKKALEILKNHILISRELMRKCYGLHKKYLERLSGSQK